MSISFLSGSLGKEDRYALYKAQGVLILPEFMAVKHFPDPGTVMIRINDMGFEPLLYPEMYDDVLEVRFADIDNPSMYDVMMQPHHAKGMVDFMEKWKDKRLVVHCQAGISRSSATACAWAYLHGKPELETLIRNSPLFCPNAHVYRSLVTEIESRRAAP